MYNLVSNISVGQYEWDFVTEVETESSWDQFTDTARLVLPRKLTFDGKPVIESAGSLFRAGDAVTVRLGYQNTGLQTVFVGRLKSIQNKTPITLICEDEMYELKRGAKTKSYKNTTLSEVIGDVYSGKKVTANVGLGQFRYSKKTPAKLLELLKKNYKLYSWFRNKTLYVGTPHLLSRDYRATWNYSFQLNIVSDNLTYASEEDSKIKVKAISTMPDNSKIEIEVGDADGEQRTLHYYNLDRSALQEAAQREIDSLRFEGYRGDLTVFGINNVKHGDAVRLSDKRFPERDGTYLVKTVKHQFGQSGYRQVLSLERKIA